MNIWFKSKNPVPKIFDKNRSERALENIKIDSAGIRELLESAFSHSEYLTRIARSNSEIVDNVFLKNPDILLNEICQTTKALAKITERKVLMKELRYQKKMAAFLIAMADIKKLWNVEQVMEANTKFADACLEASLEHLVNAEEKIKAGGGVVIIAMGKYGARELNYSSDIDIIIFYDASFCHNLDEASRVYPKLARNLVEIMQKQTEHGYVFRTDLSLRPDPGTTQAAIDLRAARNYYESLGQNWERAAFIKARFAVGNKKLGEDFLKDLQDFIWRKYLDYAVLEDIHAMKRQTNTAIGWEETATSLEDRDIKRASGGIRDIEMFVQSQQLIAGGRDKLLRRQKTCVMLTRLAAKKWIDKKTARDLIAAYRFFRLVEHRIQMVADEQTHKLPSSEENWHALALFCGFENTDDFKKALHQEMNVVRKHYVELFKQSPSLAAKTGSLIFTGGEDDPETLESLSRLGFKQPEFITKTIRGWHASHIKITTSSRVRELLTQLTPNMLEVLGKTPDPHEAFLRINRLFASLNSGVQFFSLLQSNPQLIELVALICGTAPRLADDLAQKPNMIEAMLIATHFSENQNLVEELAGSLSHYENYEDVLDDVRLQTAEHQFHLAVQVLENRIGGLDAAEKFSKIAEAAIIVLQEKVLNEFVKTHGVLEKSEIAILATGSLGAREMTLRSDLDIIFIYDGEDEISDGAKPLNAKQYWLKFTQMMVQALTVPTSKGKLYDVDMRLRPSGNSGPVAVSLESFEDYQNSRAWVWEHMALTRTRPITGSDRLRQKISSIIKSVLAKPRNADMLKKEILEMRSRITKQRKPNGNWDISAVRGGLIDAEFICAYMQLLNAAQNPEILHYSTIVALDNITQAGIADLTLVRDAEGFYKNMAQLLHASVGRIGADEEIPILLRAKLVQAGKQEDWNALKITRDRHYKLVNDYFLEYIDINKP